MYYLCSCIGLLEKERKSFIPVTTKLKLIYFGPCHSHIDFKKRYILFIHLLAFKIASFYSLLKITYSIV